MEIEKKYSLVLDEKKKSWYVRLSDQCGIWSFCIISFGQVRFVQENPELPPKMLFEHEFNYVPEFLKNCDELKNNAKECELDLINLLGNILFDILYKNSSRIKEDGNSCKLDFFNDVAEMILPQEDLTNDTIK